MTGNDTKNSFRHIARVTSLFGGVQFANILMGLVRNKCIALWMGTEGTGIAGLLTGTLALVGSATDFGLGPSAVREVAAADGAGNGQQVARTAQIVRRWMLCTGLMGTVATLAVSPWLSRLAARDERYAPMFMAASVTLWIGQLTLSRMSVMQGLQRLRDTARAQLLGGLCGLIVSIPMYWYLGAAAVLPALLATTLSAWVVAEWIFRKQPLAPVEMTWASTWRDGQGMLALGLSFAVNGIVAAAAPYVIRIFISAHGSVAEVGLFTAGFGVLNQYVGMLFGAMVADYFPRLTRAVQQRGDWHAIVNHQGSFLFLVIGPVLVTFIALAPTAVSVLFSDRFLPANWMMRWAAVGVLFKAMSWPIAFLPVPSSHGKLYAVSELSGQVCMVSASVVGYQVWGLTGLGMGYTAAYMLYFLQTAAIARIRYGFVYSADSIKVLLPQLLMVLLALLGVSVFRGWKGGIFGVLVVAMSIVLSWRRLEAELQLSERIRGMLRKSQG